MTNLTDSVTPAPTAVDPRVLFARAIATSEAVVEAIRPDQLGDPTPCSRFDVRALLGHTLAVIHRVAGIGRGDDPFASPDQIEAADAGWGAAWRAAAAEVESAWRDDAVLDRIVVLPWMQEPAGTTLGVYTSELTVHTWDLATATGQNPSWDGEVLDASLDAIARVLPAEGRAAAFEAAIANMPEELRAGVEPPFAGAIAPAADAPPIDRLVAWCGRDPRQGI